MHLRIISSVAVIFLASALMVLAATPSIDSIEALVSDDNNSQAQISSDVLDSGGSCEAPMMSDWNYPESPLTPPWWMPALGNPYPESNTPCSHLLKDFCQAIYDVPMRPDVSCRGLFFHEHVIPFFCYSDDVGKSICCVVEPQINASYCDHFDNFRPPDGDKHPDPFFRWAKETLCRKFYGLTEEQCNEMTPENLIVSFCRGPGGIGKKCEKKGERRSCLSPPWLPPTDWRVLIPLICSCDPLLGCRWQRN